MTLMEASKATGFTVTKILEVENGKDLEKTDIERMGKAYGLNQDEMKQLQSELTGAQPAKTDSSNTGGEKKR